MSSVETVFSSNLIQLIATFIGGAVLYLVCQRYQKIFKLIGYFFSFGIFFSFLFSVGEVYTYSDYYKRAFCFFGDDITTVLLLFFCYAVLSGYTVFSVVLISAIFLSGGKISLILLLVMIYVIRLVNKKSDNTVNADFFKYIVIGLSMYSIINFASHVAEHTGFSAVVRDVSGLILERLDNRVERVDDRLLRGNSACKTIPRCFNSQIKAPFLQRYYSSLAGLWMTLEGGYYGDLYPTSPKDFASLMMQKNPWGMNDKYGLTYRDWEKIGATQNPYLRFGSGYGPRFLGLLLVSFFLFGVAAVFNIIRSERDPSIVFPIFFIVIIIFDQTQSWLTSGSPILVFLGFSAGHIFVTSWLKHYKIFNIFVRPFSVHPNWRHYL